MTSPEQDVQAGSTECPEHSTISERGLFTSLVTATPWCSASHFGLGGREQAARVLREWRGQATTAMEHVGPLLRRRLAMASRSQSSRSACGREQRARNS